MGEIGKMAMADETKTGGIGMPHSTADHEWYDAPYTQSEAEVAVVSFYDRHGGLGGSRVPTLEENRAEIDRLRWQAALKSWLSGVSSWGGDNKPAVRQYVQHVKSAGMLA